MKDVESARGGDLSQGLYSFITSRDDHQDKYMADRSMILTIQPVPEIAGIKGDDA